MRCNLSVTRLVAHMKLRVLLVVARTRAYGRPPKKARQRRQRSTTIDEEENIWRNRREYTHTIACEPTYIFLFFLLFSVLMVTYNRRSSRVLSVGCSELIFSTNKSDDGDEEESRALWAPAKHRPSILHTKFMIFFFCSLLSFRFAVACTIQWSFPSLKFVFRSWVYAAEKWAELGRIFTWENSIFRRSIWCVVEFFHYFNENLWDLLADFSVKIADFLEFHAKINKDSR